VKDNVPLVGQKTQCIRWRAGTRGRRYPRLAVLDRNYRYHYRRCAVYSTSFKGLFVLDDMQSILRNFDVHHLWPPWPAMFGPLNLTRPLVGLTLAVNYVIGQDNPWGYHLFNLIVHILCAQLLFLVVRHTLCLYHGMQAPAPPVVLGARRAPKSRLEPANLIEPGILSRSATTGRALCADLAGPPLADRIGDLRDSAG